MILPESDAHSGRTVAARRRPRAGRRRLRHGVHDWRTPGYLGSSRSMTPHPLPSQGHAGTIPEGYLWWATETLVIGGGWVVLCGSVQVIGWAAPLRGLQWFHSKPG